MIEILRYLKDPKLWEFYYGIFLFIGYKVGFLSSINRITCDSATQFLRHLDAQSPIFFLTVTTGGELGYIGLL